MSFARLVLSTASLQTMPTVADSLLPARYAAISVIQHYLDHIHTLYPLLSETKLFGSIDATYSEGGRDATPMDHWSVRMVLAVALASLSQKRGDSSYQEAVKHATVALQYVEFVIRPGLVSGLQAILLLVLFGT